MYLQATVRNWESTFPEHLLCARRCVRRSGYYFTSTWCGSNASVYKPWYCSWERQAACPGDSAALPDFTGQEAALPPLAASLWSFSPLPMMPSLQPTGLLPPWGCQVVAVVAALGRWDPGQVGVPPRQIGEMGGSWADISVCLQPPAKHRPTCRGPPGHCAGLCCVSAACGGCTGAA